MTASFTDLGLAPEFGEALVRMGIQQPTEIQARSFPLVMKGGDLMAQSRTGTGKTLAYLLPVLQRLDSALARPQVLVVAPTRELAHQVSTVALRVGGARGIRVATLTGGAAYGEQLRALKAGSAIVVGTPGRLIDHVTRGTLDLAACRTVVLDEADEILDMGFQEELSQLLAALPADRQSLLFSATLSEEIEAIARKTMRDPERLGLEAGMEASRTLTHVVYEILPTWKYESLVNLLHVEAPDLAILFCHTKAQTEELATRLVEEGFKAAFLNGDLPQAQRTATLEAFRRRRIRLLVATDVAARGIDVRGISHVINYDIPRGVETYIHRAGRTGRAGQEGRVLNLAAPFDRAKIRHIIHQASLTAEYRDVPQAKDVQQRLRERYFESLARRASDALPRPFESFARELLENLDPSALVSLLLEDLQTATGRLAGGHDVKVPMRAPEGKAPVSRESRPRRMERERPQRPQEAGMIRLHLNLGKADRVQPGYLVRQICDKAQIKGESLGAIALYPRYTLIDVREPESGRVITAMDGWVDDRGRRWSMGRPGAPSR